MKKLTVLLYLFIHTLTGNATITVPDSMLTILHAYYTTSPDTSLAIIQTMRERQMAPQWQLDMAEGDYCYFVLDYTKALKFFQRAYDNIDVKGDDERRLGLLERLVHIHDILYNDAELATFIHELKQEAKRQKSDADMAIADFIIGKRTHYHRHKQKGYNICIKAVEMMKNSDYFRKYNELCSNYADLLLMYMEDGRYNDAMRMSLLQEEAILRIKGMNAQSKNKETLRFAYGLRASLLARAGQQEEADRAYEEWKRQANGNWIIDKAILDYLIIYKHYQEAHDIIHDYCHMLRTQKDNYSYHMISMLTTGAQVEAALGNYDEAARHCQEIKAIADSLHIDKSESLMAKTKDIIQDKEDIARKNFKLNVLGVILIFSITIGGIVIYYTRHIRHRNKKLLKALNTLEAYRKMTTEPTITPSSPTNPSDPITPTPPFTADENERLFLKLDTKVTQDRLFLNPNFGRDDMARLIGVDKNRIGHIMAKYSDASNAAVYINTKRVEYGAKLLLTHPEYTIAAIASECGMTNTVTFNRTFKEVYGMTPSEYRANSERIAQTPE